LANNPEWEYFNRWISSGQTQKPLNEITQDDNHGCLFDGSGYSNKDGLTDEND